MFDRRFDFCPVGTELIITKNEMKQQWWGLVAPPTACYKGTSCYNF